MSSAQLLVDAGPRPAAVATPARRNLLDIDAASFQECFDKTPFFIRHHLVDHPLFSLPSLIELSRRLDPANVEYYAGKVPVNVEKELTPRTGLSIEETIQRIEECCSWMALRNIETDPEYRALLLRCLEEVKHHSEPLDPGMCRPEGFIFISSPLSLTPYHMDPEHNFLLQVRGRKTVHLLDARDRSVVSERQLETFYAGTNEHIEFKEEYRSDAGYDVTPGLGLYFPVTAPHWVENGDAVSISFSITFRTPALERRSILYKVNDYLRNHGYHPAAVGQSGVRDFFKYNSYRVLRRLRGLWPGGKSE